MEEKELTRHTFVFLTPSGKMRLLEELSPLYEGEARERFLEVFSENDIPGTVRRAKRRPGFVAAGFVPVRRLSDGNRLRIASYVPESDIRKAVTVYDIFSEESGVRTRCVEAAVRIHELAKSMGLTSGALGSAGLEIVTGLPYTDEASDLDFLVKPARLHLLREFFERAKSMYPALSMDFEVEMPNGYGVKLEELLMDTRTVLGKSLRDVTLLDREEIRGYFM